MDSSTINNLVTDLKTYARSLNAWTNHLDISCQEQHLVGYIQTLYVYEPIYLAKNYGLTCPLITTNGDAKFFWDIFNKPEYSIYIFNPPNIHSFSKKRTPTEK